MHKLLHRTCFEARSPHPNPLPRGEGTNSSIERILEKESIMALISLRQLLDHAAEHGYGVPAFNVNNLEQTRAIMEAAAETRSPVIMQASAGARKYAGSNFLRHMILAAIDEFPDVPICMHQDHGVSPAICQRSIQLGFSSVMMDGSLLDDGKTPADYEYNVRVTREVVALAHACGVSVEGELGCLGSLESGMAGEEDGVGAEGVLSHDQMLTDPEEAADFVQKTHVDALAIAVGTSHGAYKFTRPPTGDILAIDRIKEIHRRIPNTHLVMHGSSSVPQNWLAIINQYGGKIGETYGVPVEQIVEGIKHGVRKVNIDTDLRLASTGAIRQFLAKNPAEFDPRKYLKETIKEMKAVCKERYEAFGTAGNADKIKVLSLEAMAERYEKGSLNPNVK
jgi:fructose-bisphosphate aldolase class II